MRMLASVVGSLGLILAAYLALNPVTVEAPHADGRCGPPLVRVLAQEHVSDPNAQAIIDRCEEAGTAKLVLAGTSTAVGAAAFVVLRLVARRQEAARRRARRARRAQQSDEQRDEQRRAEETRARFEAAVERDAALRG